jgi:hypothetical protein
MADARPRYLKDAQAPSTVPEAHAIVEQATDPIERGPTIFGILAPSRTELLVLCDERV